jgi:hypothetical protein
MVEIGGGRAGGPDEGVDTEWIHAFSPFGFLTPSWHAKACMLDLRRA